ncbi:hypothetical protein [Marinimicrobium agarilyticum]|uniref:hypothetical protein n=1 Tax=Marinimicrobium TaxID=359337 RepID=UPI0012F686B2|nr:hypothetical protein [Marinimicrobium agarilyticum]
MLVDSSEKFHWYVTLGIFSSVTAILLVVGQIHARMEASSVFDRAYLPVLSFTEPVFAPMVGFLVIVKTCVFAYQKTGDDRWILSKSFWGKQLIVAATIFLTFLFAMTLPSVFPG